MAREHGLYGTVYLVGAGPGDPDLITRKGLRCLRMADAVIYDRLVNPELLDEASLQAERIFVGKKPGCHAIKQEEISSLLIHYARLGCCVVRLKGGDPFIFGRGGEEALALSAAGIPFEVVPGVSSAIAVPTYAGITVTQRDYSGSVTIVTGHEQQTQALAAVNWDALAKTGGTLVILMGVEGLSQITRRLLDGGLAPETEAAVIQQGTMPQQRVVKGTLTNIAQRAMAERIQSPAITVIGAVVALSDALNWFDRPSPWSAEKLAIISTDFGEPGEVSRRKVSEVIK